MFARLLYTFLFYLLAPVFLFRLFRKRPNTPAAGKRWREYFGAAPELKGQNPIWIHAASVGETIAISPLIKAIKQAYPQQAIVLTTTTTTGAEQAAKLGELVEHRYMPLDFSWAVRAFLRRVQPKAMLIVETELWLNALVSVKRVGIPIFVLNARLSERSYKRYAKFSAIARLIASSVDGVLCQHHDDAERFQRLGFKKENVLTVGSVKYDLQIADAVISAADDLREKLGVGRLVWIAASTHEGEDEQILSSHRELLKKKPESLLVLVPRHPQRFEAVDVLCRQQGFDVVRRTSSQSVTANTQVYLADTMGEMLQLLGAADVVFMGGSLVGDSVGGHNLLEPAALAKPVITGPSIYNFNDIAQQLMEVGACRMCQDNQQLAEMVGRSFENPKQACLSGRAGFAVVEKNRGALEKTLAFLRAKVL